MRNGSDRFCCRTKIRQFSFVSVLFSICLAPCLVAQPDEPMMPVHARSEDGAEFRWLQKKVLDSRVLDHMEDLATWSFTGAGEMTLTTDRAKDGTHALRIRFTCLGVCPA